MSAHAVLGQRTLQRETTRRELVAAGLRVVADKGFAGTTTASVAKLTGKAHGTVFVHFPTRDALVAELIAEIGRVLSRQLSALESSVPSVADVLDAHLLALAEHEQLYARLLCEASTLPLSAHAQIFALQSGIAARLRTAHARERREGKVRDIDPVALGNIWISLSNHYLMHRELFAPGASVIKQCGGAIKAQLLALLQP